MVIIFVLNSFEMLVPVIRLLPLSSKFTLFDCFVKTDMGPVNIFPSQRDVATGKGFLTGSSVLAWQAPAASTWVASPAPAPALYRS